jgi:hypothetical protein
MASVASGFRQSSQAEQAWRDRIAKWRASGQSVRVFCAEHQLSEPSFYSWRRILTRRDGDAIPSPADSPDRNAPADRPAFVPVHIVAPPSTNGSAAGGSAGLELVIGSGRVVRIPSDFDAATLRRLLVVLEEAASC